MENEVRSIEGLAPVEIVVTKQPIGKRNKGVLVGLLDDKPYTPLTSF